MTHGRTGMAGDIARAAAVVMLAGVAIIGGAGLAMGTAHAAMRIGDQHAGTAALRGFGEGVRWTVRRVGAGQRRLG